MIMKPSPEELVLLNQKIKHTELAMINLIRNFSSEDIRIINYGAVDIDPKHLVFWIITKSDAEKMKLKFNSDLQKELKNLFYLHKYPEEACKNISIGFESEETVKRESNGNWYHHFK